jgi:flagellar hook protein FlgE
MIGSMICGVSGLKANSKALTVIGDNIANSNTVGFKSNNTEFQNVLGQSLLGGTVNLYGSGVAIAGINSQWEQGSLETTSGTFDMAINGSGFFRVSDPKDATELYYTRAGDFSLDENGNLVNPEGYIVHGYASNGAGGWAAAPPTTVNIALADYGPPPVAGTYRDITLLDDGIITGVDVTTGTVTELYKVAVCNFTNLDGLIRQGGNLFEYSVAAGAIAMGESDVNNMGSIVAGSLEMSNVDLSTEFVNLIVTQRAYQANSKVITTSDEMLQTLMTLKQ